MATTAVHPRREVNPGPPKRRHKAGDLSGATNTLVPALACFKVAAIHLGASSAAALRRRFDRGIYPGRFIVHLTPNRPGVDLHAILAWIRRGGRDSEGPSGLLPGPKNNLRQLLRTA